MGISRGQVSVGRRPSPGSANGLRYSVISSVERVRRTAPGKIFSMKKFSCRTIFSPVSERNAFHGLAVAIGPVEAEGRAPVMNNQGDPFTHIQGLEQGVEVFALLDEAI